MRLTLDEWRRGYAEVSVELDWHVSGSEVLHRSVFRDLSGRHWEVLWESHADPEGFRVEGTPTKAPDLHWCEPMPEGHKERVRIAKSLVASGYAKDDVAARFGITRKALSRWLRWGERKVLVQTHINRRLKKRLDDLFLERLEQGESAQFDELVYEALEAGVKELEAYR